MQQQESKIDLRRFWRAVKQWKWVMLAIIVLFTAAGIWKAVRSLPKYEIQGGMLIGEIGYDQDNRSGGISQMMKTFSVGGFSASTVDNEVIIIQSHDVMLRTVRALGLNRTYIGENAKGKKAMLYKDTPVKVEAPAEQFDTLGTSFVIQIKLKEKGKTDIKAVEGFFKKTLCEANDVTLPYMLKTPYGSYQIMATGKYAGSPYRDIDVTVIGNELAATNLYLESTIDVATKMSDIIKIDYPCANKELGKATVNAIMAEYNAKRLDRLHEASIASIKYYDERIAETFKVLQEQEKKVSDYQRKNELMGIDSELGILVGEAVNSKSAIQTANYNIAYYETVLNILRNKLDDDVIIPQMESLSDPNIGAFNGAIQARRDLRRSATEDNEALKRLNDRIEELRNLIIENSSKMIAKAKADVQHQQNLASSAKGRLDEYPDYQLEFMNLLRDKEYQNQLYQYLVNQRENSVLQLYSSTNIGFIYQQAYVVKKSGILKKLIWPVALFVFSIFCCVCLAIFLVIISRKVNDPMDLAFIGLDNRAVKLDGNDESVNRLRTLVLSRPDNRVLFFNPLNGTSDLRQKFVDSLTAAGRNVEILTGAESNNTLLTPAFQQQVKSALETNEFVIIDVPQPEQVSDIENVIDAPGACLVVSLQAGKISRKRFKKILKGQTADKIYIIITD